jgi:hypothetical protein
MKPSRILILIGLECIGIGIALASTQPLPISDVVKMSQSGVPPAKLIERVRSTRTSYALRGSDYGKLKAVGVSDAVLDFLQQSLVNDVDLLTRYWTGGSSLGGCKSCYPQPVDMDRMASGYGGADSNAAGRDRSRPAARRTRVGAF